MRRTSLRGLLTKALLLAVVVSLWTAEVGRAQGVAGGIAGVVKDASGAVLPGVTVEASSPALIEKTRTVVTDGQGQYKVIELRPGTYTVTFSLTGFSTVKREGIELTSGFTAAVNAELVVGAVEETITVSGSAAVVDTQNVRRQDVFSAEKLAVLPTSKALTAYAALTAGLTLGGAGTVVQDVGGNQGEVTTSLMIHNSRSGDFKEMLDGTTLQFARGTGGGIFKVWYSNPALAEEVVMETSGIGAESETAGVQVNYVPKDGGNTFRGVVMGNYTGQNLQANNLDDALRARGLSEQAKTKLVFDANVGFGGPLVQDRLWFFASQRRMQSESFVAGNYFNKTPHTVFYTADLDRPAYVSDWRTDLSTRLTWQATTKHKVTVMPMFQDTCSCFQSATNSRSPEAAYNYHGDWMPRTQLSWSYPATNRLLVQAAYAVFRGTTYPDRGVEGTEHDVSVTDTGLGFTYGSFPGLASTSPGKTFAPFQTSRFAVSYVTGSHAFKAGFTTYRGYDNAFNTVNQIPGLGTVTYTFNNRVPTSVTYWASPLSGEGHGSNIGFYGQDQWTINRLTLNLGVRFDYLHQWVPAQTTPATDFTPSLTFAAVDVSTWKDVSPRLGAAFDVFGNGKTAVKGSVGRYVIGDSTSMARNVDPAFAISRSASRTWTDANRDYVPQESELGPLSNAAFGTVVVNTTYDPSLLQGWRVRPYTWQANVSLQQELRPGMGLYVGYHRTWYGNTSATDNLLIGPASFDPFCATAPSDDRLPGGGGYQVCGYQDIKPTAFGRVQNLVITPGEDLGTLTEVYDGVDVGLNTRFGDGGLFTASFNTGQTTTNSCTVIDNPAGIQSPGGLNAPGGARPREWCETTNPMKGQTQLKLSGSYPLPAAFAISGVFQSLPGIPRVATYTLTNAQVVPTLGRNLGACGLAAPIGQCSATTSVFMIEPFTQFEPRLEQVDVRLSRVFRFGRTRLNAQMDVYNVLNANNVLSQQAAYGSRWLRPLQVLAARTVKFGGQLNF